MACRKRGHFGLEPVTYILRIMLPSLTRIQLHLHLQQRSHPQNLVTVPFTRTPLNLSQHAPYIFYTMTSPTYRRFPHPTRLLLERKELSLNPLLSTGYLAADASETKPISPTLQMPVLSTPALYLPLLYIFPQSRIH